MANVCVVGAGSIGAIVAVRMAQAGHTVSVVARGAHLEAIRRDGLTLIDASATVADPQAAATTTTVRLAASADPRDFGVQDLVVLGVKAPSIDALLDPIAPTVGADTIVVPAINGIPWWYFHRDGSSRPGRVIRCLDPQGTMFQRLDPDRIVGCVVYAAAEIPRPGVVRQTAGGRMVIGEPAGPATDRTQRLADWWNASGLETRIDDDVRHAIWIKLTGNLSFNPVAAITGYRTDQMVADEALLDVIRAMIDEAKAVAAALGTTVRVDTEQRVQMARSIGRSRPSTLQDFEAGRRPELEGLLDAVIELAAETGVPVPTIRHVAALTWARARQLGLVA